MTDSRRIAFALIGAHVLLLIYLAFSRPIDADEGYYAAAAQLLGDGELPYRQYFFPQAPGFPLIYASATLLFPGNLIALRLLSVVFSAVTVLILYRLLARRRISENFQLVLLAIYVANPGVLAWGSTAKTYSMAGFFLATALYLAERAPTDYRRVFLAGFFLGLSSTSRLLYLLPFVSIAVVFALNKYHKSTVLLGLGGLVGLSPLVAALLCDWETASFGNLGYHTLRATPPYLPRRILSAIDFLISASWKAPWVVLTIGFGMVGSVFIARKKPGTRWLDDEIRGGALAAAAFGALLVGALLPWPLYPQYLEMPLAAPAVLAVAVPGLRTRRRIFNVQRFFVIGPILAAGLYLTPLRIHANSQSQRWDLKNYEAVTATVAKLTNPQDTVLALWPGYVFGAHRVYQPGFENHFALRVSSKLAEAQQKRLHLGTPRQFIEALKNGRTSVVVIGGWTKDLENASSPEERAELERLLRLKFNLAFESHGVQVYRGSM